MRFKNAAYLDMLDRSKWNNSPKEGKVHGSIEVQMMIKICGLTEHGMAHSSWQTEDQKTLKTYSYELLRKDIERKWTCIGTGKPELKVS